MKTPALRRSQAALGGLLLLAACHHADPAPEGCKLTYSRGPGDYFTYLYNTGGQLTGALTPTVFGELHYTYSYAGSQVKLPVTYGNNYSWQYWLLTLNTQGYLAAATSYYAPGGGQVREQTTFGYDADGHLTSYRMDAYTLGVPTTPVQSLRVRLDYQGGDLTQVFDSVGKTLTKLDYTPQANPLHIPLLVENILLYALHLDPGLLPLAGKPTAHLVSALRIVQPASPYPYSATFTYTLTTSGQLTTFTTNNGTPTTYTLSSTCP